LTKKRYRYSAVNIAKQQLETLLDFSYRKTIKDNKINKGINTEESSKLLDRYNNDKTKLSDSFISFDNNDILSTNKFDKKYVKNVDENEYIILEKHNDLINSICDKTKNINKKNINITQIPTSFYNEEIKYQHDNIPADKNKTSTTNYSASIKEGDNEILDENAGALSQNEVKQEEDTLIKTKSKFSELVIVNEKSNKHRFDTLKQDNSNILEVLFYTRQDDTLPFIFQNYTNLQEVNLHTNSNECVAILNNQDNYKKIFCIDQTCLDQSKKRQIIDIDIKKKEKEGQHILMTEKEHKEILPKIKQKFCQNFNEFLGISRVTVNISTILETIFLKKKEYMLVH